MSKIVGGFDAVEGRYPYMASLVYTDRDEFGIPSTWICPDSFFNDNLCDCGCGFPDPDCVEIEIPIFGCPRGDICIDDVCVSAPTTSPTFNPTESPTFNPTVSPTFNPTFSPTFSPTGNPTFSPTIAPIPVPPEWICSVSFFNSRDGCDCECGAIDPDCEFQTRVVDTFFCNRNTQICVDGICVDTGEYYYGPGENPYYYEGGGFLVEPEQESSQALVAKEKEQRHLQESDYYYFDRNIVNRGHFCGGTVISSRAILTAAICVAHLSPNEVQVAIGCTDISDLSNCQLNDVTDIVVNPLFTLSRRVLGDDQAILILAQPTKVTPVQLASPLLTLGESDVVRVMGWGETLRTTIPSRAQLQEADVELVDTDDCIAQNIDVFAVRFGDEPKAANSGNLNSTICTLGDGVGDCIGDSGGPVVYACDVGGEDIQIATSSFRTSCGGEGTPSVHESVNSVSGFNFITTTLANFGLPPATFVDSLQGFCPEDPIVSRPSPTPFPTFVEGVWTCNLNFFGTNDGCDCNCGLPDPDCAGQPRVIFGCNRQTQRCVDAVCVDAPTLSPTDNPTASPTFNPTFSPTFNPTSNPTFSPTSNPTGNPTRSPTQNPTETGETRSPSPSPTLSPLVSAGECSDRKFGFTNPLGNN